MARHELPLKHVTADSVLDAAPVAFGVGWSDHALPLWRSATVSQRGALPSKWPTLSHVAAATHATAVKDASFSPDGFGVV
jgi:hypothetical protein